MNPSRDPGFEPRIAAWLEEDPAAAPAQVLETVLAAIPSVAQRRGAGGVPWRYLRMTAPLRAAAGVAAVLVIAIGSFVILNGPLSSNVGGSPSPSPSRTPTPGGPLDGTSWTTDIVASDTPTGVPAVAVGTWTLSFVASDVYGTTATLGNPHGGGPGFTVKYLANNEVQLPSDPACATEEHRPTGDTTSTYRYEITGNILTFTLVTTDSCIARVVNLTAHPWTKAP